MKVQRADPESHRRHRVPRETSGDCDQIERTPATSQGVDVRVLAETDAKAYQALRLQSLEHEPHAFGTSAEEYRVEPLEAVRQALRLEPEGNFTVGAFLSGQLVGIASFTRYHALKLRHRGHVGSVYVDERARGQGIGQALLEALIARVKQYGGLERLSLTVMAGQAAAQRLYRRLGFKTSCTEHRTLRVGDTYLDQKQMVLWLEPIS